MNGEEGTTATSGLDRLASVNLNLLVPLLALLEERSVTRAAERIGLSQPAMSHALTRMRRLLGDDLVVRQGSGVTITPRALELIAPLRGALRQTARVVDFPSFDPATDERVCTVAMTDSTAFVVGPRLTRLVAERAPHATLRIRRLYDDRCVVVASTDTPPQASALDLLTTEPHVVVDTDRRVFPYSVLENEAIPYRVGRRHHAHPRRPADRGVPVPAARARHRHGVEPAPGRPARRRLAAGVAARRRGRAVRRPPASDQVSSRTQLALSSSSSCSRVSFQSVRPQCWAT
jgi:DNA-binding transcriptional LysR family regulator